MPSFVFSIASLPRSFGGLLFSVLKIFHADNPSVPVVPEYSMPPQPTKTTPLYLPPTSCIPGPSSIPSELPVILLLGFAMATIAILVCIVCTIYDDSPPDTRPPPPPPPPKPTKLKPKSSSSNKDPWLRVIWVYVGILVFGAPIAHHLYFDKPRLVGDLGTRIMLMTEKAFIDVWDTIESLFSLHIVPHWRQYLRTGSLAFTGHSLGLLAFFTYRRLFRPVVLILQTPGPSFFSLPFIIPIALFASTSKLSWILWVTYYSLDPELPRLQTIHHWLHRLPSAVYSFVGATDSLDIWVIFGPFILNIVTLALLTVVLTIHAVPWALREMQRDREFIHYVILVETITVASSTSFLSLYLPGSMLRLEYNDWPPESQRFWQSIYCPDARAETRRMLGSLLESYLRWKEKRIRELGALGRDLHHDIWGAFGVCMETWRMLHLIHKLLIVLPITVLFGHYYVMPAIRSRWYSWRYRRRRRI